MKKKNLLKTQEINLCGADVGGLDGQFSMCKFFVLSQKGDCEFLTKQGDYWICKSINAWMDKQKEAAKIAFEAKQINKPYNLYNLLESYMIKKGQGDE